MEIKKRFGRGLRRARRSQKLTQQEVGLRMGAEQGYISRVEAGEINVTLETIERFSEAIGVEPAVFFE